MPIKVVCRSTCAFRVGFEAVAIPRVKTSPGRSRPILNGDNLPQEPLQGGMLTAYKHDDGSTQEGPFRKARSRYVSWPASRNQAALFKEMILLRQQEFSI